MQTKRKILLVSVNHLEALSSFFLRSGLDAICVRYNPKEIFVQISSTKPDLIVLDIIYPQLNGRELVRQLREFDDWTPVILLSDIGDAAEKAIALEEGADDYLNKSVDPYELLARARAILRRVTASAPTTIRRIKSDNLLLDQVARKVWLGSQELSLTPKAVSVLEYLMSRSEELITRDKLLDVIWGWDCSAGTRAVDARIAELRRVLRCDPLKAQCIETVLGEGYRFIGNVEVELRNPFASHV